MFVTVVVTIPKHSADLAKHPRMFLMIMMYEEERGSIMSQSSVSN